MRRVVVPGLVAVVALGVLALLIFGVARDTINSSLDAKLARGVHPVAPDAGVRLPLLIGGGTETLAGLRGKVVVIDVFATWCVPCRAEAPMLERVQRQIAPHGATILGVAYEDSTPDDQQFVKSYGITYPIVRDVSGNFAHAFGASGVPETYLIDRQGRVAAVVRQQLAGTGWLDHTLARLLAAPV